MSELPSARVGAPLAECATAIMAKTMIIVSRSCLMVVIVLRFDSANLGYTVALCQENRGYYGFTMRYKGVTDRKFD